MKNILKILLSIGGIVAGIVGIIQLYEYAMKEKIIIYDDDYILLPYEEVVEFENFLRKNAWETVKFKTQISFDAVLPINLLAHEVCNYELVLDNIENPDEISTTKIGLMHFEDDFTIPEDGFIFPESTINNVSCHNSIRIVMKNSSSLELSFGGTGTISLPLIGLFVIEMRFFSGPRIEYTLREI